MIELDRVAHRQHEKFQDYRVRLADVYIYWLRADVATANHQRNEGPTHPGHPHVGCSFVPGCAWSATGVVGDALLAPDFSGGRAKRLSWGGQARRAARVLTVGLASGHEPKILVVDGYDREDGRVSLVGLAEMYDDVLHAERAVHLLVLPGVDLIELPDGVGEQGLGWHDVV